jgi:hypothetical protein
MFGWLEHKRFIVLNGCYSSNLFFVLAKEIMLLHKINYDYNINET